MLQPSPLFHNLLLQQLPEPDLNLIAPHLETRSFEQGAVLFEPGAEQRRVYFPLSGMVSLLTIMQDGHSIETAVVGHEGLVGAMPEIDLSTRHIRAVVLLPATMYVLPSDLFRKLAEESPALRDMGFRNSEGLLAQVRVTSACNALHPVSSRVCRILLRSAEVVESDELPLTQELLSDILGVRRTSVTDAAQHLKKQGIISYKRGRITVLDRAALLAQCCECHGFRVEQDAMFVSECRNHRSVEHDERIDSPVSQKLLRTA